MTSGLIIYDNLFFFPACYGVYDRDESTDWYCDKCKVLNSYYEKFRISEKVNNDKYLEDCIADIKCSLCCIRGGALKETTTKGWCHIVCAISIPEICFQNKRDRGPIDTTALNPARKNLVSSFSFLFFLFSVTLSGSISFFQNIVNEEKYLRHSEV